MSKSATTTFRMSGAELRALAASGDAAAKAEIARRAALPGRSYTRQCLSAGARPAYWNHAQPDISPAVEQKLRTKGVMAAMLQSLKEGALTPPSKPEPAVSAPSKAPRDTIAAVRRDLGALANNVASLASSVDALAKAVSAQMKR